MAKVSKDRKQEIEDLKAVMSSPAGRRFIWRQLEQAGVYEACFTPESEGGRRIGLFLLHELITECPGEYLKMQSEKMSQDTRKRIEKENKKEVTDEPIG